MICMRAAATMGDGVTTQPPCVVLPIRIDRGLHLCSASSRPTCLCKMECTTPAGLPCASSNGWSTRPTMLLRDCGRSSCCRIRSPSSPPTSFARCGFCHTRKRFQMEDCGFAAFRMVRQERLMCLSECGLHVVTVAVENTTEGRKTEMCMCQNQDNHWQNAK